MTRLHRSCRKLGNVITMSWDGREGADLHIFPFAGKLSLRPVGALLYCPHFRRHARCIGQRMDRFETVLSVASIFVTGCVAPLSYQASTMFADAFACPVEQVKVSAPAGQRDDEDTWHGVMFDARGCGHRQAYVCSRDVGCMRPNNAPAELVPPGSTAPHAERVPDQEGF